MQVQPVDAGQVLRCKREPGCVEFLELIDKKLKPSIFYEGFFISFKSYNLSNQDSNIISQVAVLQSV